MNSNSDAIKQVMRDYPNDDRLREFCKLYDEIEKLPNGRCELARAIVILKVLAGWQMADFPAELDAAPARSERTERIFRRFADATFDMINCAETPEDVRRLVEDMVLRMANELDGGPDFDGAYAYRVLAKVLDIDE